MVNYTRDYENHLYRNISANIEHIQTVINKLEKNDSYLLKDQDFFIGLMTLLCSSSNEMTSFLLNYGDERMLTHIETMTEIIKKVRIMQTNAIAM